ncbi:hypothetical protein ACET3Z_013515 [Daucus carota]
MWSLSHHRSCSDIHIVVRVQLGFFSESPSSFSSNMFMAGSRKYYVCLYQRLTELDGFVLSFDPKPIPVPDIKCGPYYQPSTFNQCGYSSPTQAGDEVPIVSNDMMPSDLLHAVASQVFWIPKS